MHEEEPLLTACLEQLQRRTGLTTNVRLIDAGNESAGVHVEGWVHIEGANGSGEFGLEVKARLRSSTVQAILSRAALLHQSTSKAQLLCTAHVSSELGMTLRRAGAFYLDTSGNAFLKASGIHVHIEGMAAVSQRGRRRGRPSTSPLARPAGLRVIRAILRNPQLIHALTRSIATAANVSQPTVARVLRELSDEGWIRIVGRNRRCDRFPELHRRWVDGYLDVLRPALDPIRVSPMEVTPTELQNQLRSQATSSNGIVVGGPMMAGDLGADLRSNSGVLYVPAASRRAVMAKLRLRPDEDGPLTLLDALDDDETPPNPGQPLADALDLHAELMFQADSRTVAAAKFIRDTYLIPRWSEA